LEGEANSRERNGGTALDCRLLIHGVDDQREVRRHYVFLEQSPRNELKAGYGVRVFEFVFFPKLMKQVLGFLDRSGGDLRKEENVEREDHEGMLRGLPPAVDLDHVTHRLERVERKANGNG